MITVYYTYIRIYEYILQLFIIIGKMFDCASVAHLEYYFCAYSMIIKRYTYNSR